MAIPAAGYDYEADALADGVLHYWPMWDKYTPSICTDIIGGLNLTPFNDSSQDTLVQDMFGYCRDLTVNGTGTNHSVLQYGGSTTDFTEIYDWSIALWFNPDSITYADEPYLLYMENGEGISVRFKTTNSISVVFTSTSISDITGTSTPTLNNDHLLLVTCDSATDTVTVYVDNVQIGTLATGFQTLQLHNPSWIVGGKNIVVSSTNYFDGRVDEMAIFDHALDTTDRATLWNTGSGMVNNLVKYANEERVLHSEISGFGDTIQFIWDAIAADIVGGTVTNEGAANLFGSIAETPDFNVGNTAIMRGLPIVDEISGLEGVYTENLSIPRSVDETLGFITSFNVSGETYIGVVMNTVNSAVTEYEDVPYNSMTQMDETSYLAAAGDGIYAMQGDLDDTAAIDAYITTRLFHFGSNFYKRVERAYLGLRNDGPMILKVITRNSLGQRIEDWYELEETSDTIRTERVKIGKGLKSHYWQFTLSNKTGADFDLSEIEFQPIKLSRRV